MLPIQVMDLWHKASNGTQLELAWYYWFLKLFIRVTAQQWKRIASKEITRVQRILKLLETRGFPSSKTESSAHVLIRLNGLECASLDFPSISSHLVIWYAGQQINKASVYTCSASSIIFPEAIRAFNHVVCCISVQLHLGRSRIKWLEWSRSRKILYCNKKSDDRHEEMEPPLFHFFHPGRCRSISRKWPPQQVASWCWGMDLHQTFQVLQLPCTCSAQRIAARIKPYINI